MAGRAPAFGADLSSSHSMQGTSSLHNASKSDFSDKQTLLAVLQFLKKNNLKVRLISSIYCLAGIFSVGCHSFCQVN